MNGNISNNVIGELRNVRKYGYQNGTWYFSKKVISSKIPSIKINVKKIKLRLINFFKKLLIKYFL